MHPSIFSTQCWQLRKYSVYSGSDLNGDLFNEYIVKGLEFYLNPTSAVYNIKFMQYSKYFKYKKKLKKFFL